MDKISFIIIGLFAKEIRKMQERYINLKRYNYGFVHLFPDLFKDSTKFITSFVSYEHRKFYKFRQHGGRIDPKIWGFYEKNCDITKTETDV